MQKRLNDLRVRERFYEKVLFILGEQEIDEILNLIDQELEEESLKRDEMLANNGWTKIAEGVWIGSKRTENLQIDDTKWKEKFNEAVRKAKEDEF